MKKIKPLLIAWTALTSGLTLAHEINLGYIEKTEIIREFPKLSILHQGDSIKVRLKIFSPDEVKCSEFRPDFCGIENQIDMIEITGPSSSCKIENETLITCNFNIWKNDPANHVNAILKDKTIKNIISTNTTVNVGEITFLKPNALNEQVQTVTSALLYFELWGNRADGLDSLVKFETHLNLWGYREFHVVKKSLFE